MKTYRQLAEEFIEDYDRKDDEIGSWILRFAGYLDTRMDVGTLQETSTKPIFKIEPLDPREFNIAVEIPKKINQIIEYLNET